MDELDEGSVWPAWINSSVGQANRLTQWILSEDSPLEKDETFLRVIALLDDRLIEIGATALGNDSCFIQKIHTGNAFGEYIENGVSRKEFMEFGRFNTVDEENVALQVLELYADRDIANRHPEFKGLLAIVARIRFTGPEETKAKFLSLGMGGFPNFGIRCLVAPANHRQEITVNIKDIISIDISPSPLAFVI